MIAGIISRIIIGVGAVSVIISTGLSEAATNAKQYTLAMQIPGDSGDAYARIASDAYAAGEKKMAREFALEALERSLAHVSALRVAGMTAFENGDAETGLRLAEISGQLSWRDTPGQAWLLQQSLLREDYQKAILHTDALLRRRKVRDEIFGIFNLAGQQPELSELLTARFDEMPSWRNGFFASRNTTPAEQYDGFEGLVRALQNSKVPATRREMTPYILLLGSKGESNRALNLWSELFPQDTIRIAGQETSVIEWPDSDRMDEPYPIDWRFSNSRSAFASVEDPVGEGQAILDLELDRRAIGEIAFRNIIIEPGTLRLNIEQDKNTNNSLDRMRWSLTCLTSKGGPRYFQKDAASNSWRVEVGGVCNAYKLALETPLGGYDRDVRMRIGPIKLTLI